MANLPKDRDAKLTGLNQTEWYDSQLHFLNELKKEVQTGNRGWYQKYRPFLYYQVWSVTMGDADLFINQRGDRGEAPQIPPPEIRRSRISDLISVFQEYENDDRRNYDEKIRKVIKRLRFSCSCG